MTTGTTSSAAASVRRVMFLYWGRRGAMPQFMLELGRAAEAISGLETTICVSRQNEMFDAYWELGSRVLAVDTFRSHTGALTQLWRLPGLRHRLLHHIAAQRIDTVIDLMPHIWSPLIGPAIRREGVCYAPVVHDGDAHPGDATAIVKSLIDRSLHGASRVLTLSQAVSEQVAATGVVAPERIATLFLPDLAPTGAQSETIPFERGGPWRLLFLGRIMPYKGLDLFTDAMKILRDRGYPVQPGVFGEGALGASTQSLAALGAEVVNRWLTEDEISAALVRYHAVVLAHREASQSGVTAKAFGSGVPAVATPAGGLPEQIEDGVTGMIASDISAEALATAIERLFVPAGVYEAVRANIASRREDRSMRTFILRCLEATSPA